MTTVPVPDQQSYWPRASLSHPPGHCRTRLRGALKLLIAGGWQLAISFRWLRLLALSLSVGILCLSIATEVLFFPVSGVKYQQSQIATAP